MVLRGRLTKFSGDFTTIYTGSGEVKFVRLESGKRKRALFSWVCFTQLAFAFSEVTCCVCRLHAAFSGSARDLLRCFGSGSGFALWHVSSFFSDGKRKTV